MFSVVAITVPVSLATASPAHAETSTTFTTVGANTAYTVPAGVTALTIVAKGGGGSSYVKIGAAFQVIAGGGGGGGSSGGAGSVATPGGNGSVTLTIGDLTAASVNPRPMRMQSTGRTSAADTCPIGTNPSWALWPNHGTGGYVCDTFVPA